MATRLHNLRTMLERRNEDLQRAYNWKFTSFKMKGIGLFSGLFSGIKNASKSKQNESPWVWEGADLLITDAEHPYLQYQNNGDYRGFIAEVKKPPEITLTFLETDGHYVNKVLDFWDSLKYNTTSGICYPKAVYEDTGFLTYIGSAASIENGIGDNNVNKIPSMRIYKLDGFYPINRNSVALSYGQNDLVRLSVTFNVDMVTPVTSITGAL